MRNLRNFLLVLLLSLGATACGASITGPDHVPDPGSHVPDPGSHVPDPGSHVPDPGS